MVDTGLHTMTGARVKRVEKYIEDDDFILTYGDGVTDLDMNKLVKFHKSRNKIGTVTGVSPPRATGKWRSSVTRWSRFARNPRPRTP